jgi:hypothetical protein
MLPLEKRRAAYQICTDDTLMTNREFLLLQWVAGLLAAVDLSWACRSSSYDSRAGFQITTQTALLPKGYPTNPKPIRIIL